MHGYGGAENVVGAGTAISTIFVILICSLIGALTPILLTGRSFSSRPSSLRRVFRQGNAFTAGFLISAALVHLIPSASGTFIKDLPGIDFPVASALTVTGVCLVLCLDTFVRHSAHLKAVRSCDDAANGFDAAVSPSDEFAQHSPTRSRGPDGWSKGGCSPSFSCGDNPALPLLGIREGLEQRRRHQHQSGTQQALGNSKRLLALVLLVALSFHSFMEGIALGTSKVARQQFVALVFAILAHKLFAAFALGVSLAHDAVSSESPHEQRRKAVWAALGFALTTPLGAIVGLVLSSAMLPRSARLLSAVMSSISAGMFLYLAFVEMIADDFRCHCRHPYLVSNDGRCISSCDVSDVQDVRYCSLIIVVSATAMSVLGFWI